MASRKTNSEACRTSLERGDEMKSKHGFGFMVYIFINVFITEFTKTTWVAIVFQFMLVIAYWIFVFGKDEVTK